MELKYKPSDALSEFEKESLGVGPELKSTTKTASPAVSKHPIKDEKKNTQKQNQNQKQIVSQQKKLAQRELQEKLRNKREQERIARSKLFGEPHEFKPPALFVAKNNVRKNFNRAEIIPLSEISDERILIGSDEIKKIPRVTANTIEEFDIVKHPMVPTSVDRTIVENTGRTILDSDTLVVKKEQIISKTAAKKNRSKLSKANFAFDMQGNSINMNTQTVNKVESSSPVLEPENSFFCKPSESDSEEEAVTRILKKKKVKKTKTSLEVSEFAKEQFLKSEDEKELKISKRISKNIAKATKETMETQNKVELPIEVPVLEPKIDEIVEQLTQTVSEETKEVLVAETQTDSVKSDSEEIKNLHATIAKQSAKIAELEELMKKALQRIDALEQKNVEVKKTPVPKTTPKVVPPPKEIVEEQPCCSSSLKPLSPPAQVADPVRSTALRRAKTFIDDSNNLKVNFNKATSLKEKIEIAKNHLTKSESELKKAVDQEVRDVSAERVSKPFAQRLQEGLAKSAQKFKISKLEAPKIAKDPSKPNGLPVAVWEKIKITVPETESDFQKKRDELVAKKFKITFHARRQILINRWEAAQSKKELKEPNPYLRDPVAFWKHIQKVTEVDVSIFKNIEKWHNMAATYTVKGVDAQWALKDV